eukprot:12897722-Prorocentrum_lima.AAC.1
MSKVQTAESLGKSRTTFSKFFDALLMVQLNPRCALALVGPTCTLATERDVSKVHRASHKVFLQS